MTLGCFFRVFLHCSVLVTGVNCVDAQGYGYHDVQRGKAPEGLHIDTGSFHSAPNQLSDSKGPTGRYIESSQGSNSDARQGQSKTVQISPRARNLILPLARRASFYSSLRSRPLQSDHRPSTVYKNAAGGGAFSPETGVVKSMKSMFSNTVVPSRLVHKSGFSSRVGNQSPFSLMSRTDLDMRTPKVHEATRSDQLKTSSVHLPLQSGHTNNVDMSHERRAYAQVSRRKLAIAMPLSKGFKHRMKAHSGIHSRKSATSHSVHGVKKLIKNATQQPSFQAEGNSESSFEHFPMESLGLRGLRPQGKFQPFQRSPPTGVMSPVSLLIFPGLSQVTGPDYSSKASQGSASNEKSDQEEKLGPRGFNPAFRTSSGPSTATTPTSTMSSTLASLETEFTPTLLAEPQASVNFYGDPIGTHKVSDIPLTELSDLNLVTTAGPALEVYSDENDDSGEEPEENPAEPYDDEDLYILMTMSPMILDESL